MLRTDTDHVSCPLDGAQSIGHPDHRGFLSRGNALRLYSVRVRSSGCRTQGGFTLLEVMIATAVTLLMMLGLAQMFKVLGDSMNQGRAGLELNNRLRSVMHRIRTDLDNVTAVPRPPIPVGAGQGYMKIYDGPMTDYTFASDPLRNRYGDLDDIFMATVKAKDTWFTGKVPAFIVERRAPEVSNIANELSSTVTIASEFAEIVLFVQPFDSNGDGGIDTYRLHYRTLLIRPDFNDAIAGRLAGDFRTAAFNTLVTTELKVSPPASSTATSAELDLFAFHQICDLSVRRVGSTHVAANTIEDLANPANRFAHITIPIADGVASMPVLSLSRNLFPFQVPITPPLNDSLPRAAGAGFLDSSFILSGDRTGEDILATDVLAFDIRCYDSSAPIVRFKPDSSSDDEEITLRPGDPGFANIRIPNNVTFPINNTIAYGEFVDLNWAAKRNFQNRILQPNQPDSKDHFFHISELSGTKGVDSSGNPLPTDSLYRSGLVKGNPNGFQIYQPSYDTFTDYYEQDGVLQAELSGNRGLVTLLTTPAPSNLRDLDQWRASAIDAGRDGIDNTGSAGIDDASELESSPPFPVNLRGVQISVRLEDRASKQFKQMSTIKEFVTN
jgi:type II secretory pathway pseudopilin PulG